MFESVIFTLINFTKGKGEIKVFESVHIHSNTVKSMSTSFSESDHSNEGTS